MCESNMTTAAGPNVTDCDATMQLGPMMVGLGLKRYCIAARSALAHIVAGCETAGT